MTSFQEGFDDSSETRCANGVSAINKLNNRSNDSFLGEQKNNNVNDEKNDTTSNATFTDGKNTSSDEKIKRQNDKHGKCGNFCY